MFWSKQRTSSARTVRHAATARVGLVLALLLGGFFSTVQAQPAEVEERAFRFRHSGSDWKDCGLRKLEADAFTSVRPDAVKKRSITATFDVNYSGFTSEAREAFERAVSIWETHISSDVPIRIDASFEDLDRDVLGGTSPQFVYGVDTNADDQVEIFVIDAVADAISGEDQSAGTADFLMVLNSSRDDWHFGEDDAPAGTVDFTSVVLHEIAHGLGYIELSDVSNGTGEYGYQFAGQDAPTPSVFTYFLARSVSSDSFVSLTNESKYPNPSPALADALTSNELVFNGATAITTADPNTGPIPPKVYAPSNFTTASSISHLDESTYLPGGPDALMTPRLNAAETNRLPGPVLCGQMKDMLWTLGSGCRRYLPDVFALEFSETPDPSEGSVQLSWQVQDDADPQRFIVEKKYYDGPFVPDTTVQSPPVTIDRLGLGEFEFRVRWVRSDGSEATTPVTVATTFRPGNVETEIVDRDEQGRADVAVSWDVPPGTDDYVYRLERQTGVSGSFTEQTIAAETSYTVEGLSPGTYTYRITGVDASGNAVVGEDTDRVSVEFEGPVYVLGPYPNPVRGTASFDLTARSDQVVNVAIYDVAGQRLYSETRELEAHAPEFLSINANRWSSGMYFLHVRGQEFTETRRLVVTR